MGRNRRAQVSSFEAVYIDLQKKLGMKFVTKKERLKLGGSKINGRKGQARPTLTSPYSSPEKASET